MNDVTEFVVYIRPAHFVYIRAWGLMGRSRDNILTAWHFKSSNLYLSLKCRPNTEIERFSDIFISGIKNTMIVMAKTKIKTLLNQQYTR